MLVEIFTNAGMPVLLDHAATSCAFAGPKDLRNASKYFLFIYINIYYFPYFSVSIVGYTNFFPLSVICPLGK